MVGVVVTGAFRGEFQNLRDDRVETTRTRTYVPAARVVTELGAPWMVNFCTAISAGIAVGALAWGVFVAVITGGIPVIINLSVGRHGVVESEPHGVNPAILAAIGFGLVIEILLAGPRELIAWTASVLAVLAGVCVVTAVWKWKVSAHTAVAAGTTVLLAMIASPWALAALPLTAVIGWSGVRLGDHIRQQAEVGALLGITLASAAYLLTA